MLTREEVADAIADAVMAAGFDGMALNERVLVNDPDGFDPSVIMMRRFGANPDIDPIVGVVVSAGDRASLTAETLPAFIQSRLANAIATLNHGYETT